MLVRQELKLGLLCWLMFAGGADTAYRKLRRFLVNRFGSVFVANEGDIDKEQLERLTREIPSIVHAALKAKGTAAPAELSPGGTDWRLVRTSDDDSSEALRCVSSFLLSGTGAAMLEETASLSASDRALLQQSAAAEISFQRVSRASNRHTVIASYRYRRHSLTAGRGFCMCTSRAPPRALTSPRRAPPRTTAPRPLPKRPRRRPSASRRGGAGAHCHPLQSSERSYQPWTRMGVPTHMLSAT